jgi:hypothetical protein
MLAKDPLGTVCRVNPWAAIWLMQKTLSQSTSGTAMAERGKEEGIPRPVAIGCVPGSLSLKSLTLQPICHPLKRDRSCVRHTRPAISRELTRRTGALCILPCLSSSILGLRLNTVSSIFAHPIFASYADAIPIHTFAAQWVFSGWCRTVSLTSLDSGPFCTAIPMHVSQTMGRDDRTRLSRHSMATERQ